MPEPVELILVYQKENLKNVEVWFSVGVDNIGSQIRHFDAQNKDTSSESFHQNMITQVSDMPDINDYISTWTWCRQQQGKSLSVVSEFHISRSRPYSSPLYPCA